VGGKEGPTEGMSFSYSGVARLGGRTAGEKGSEGGRRNL